MTRFTSYLKYPKILEVEHIVTNSFSKIIGGTFKRIFDFLAALVGLIVLLPLFLVIAALIKHDDTGPVFYRGPRAGKNGRPFGILKFRTMYERKESYNGPHVTCKEDSRITPIGHWLRDTKINELPQLWNVLIGEMSLVGPRPEDIEIVETWPANIRREILSVRPGITSPASILYHDEERLLSSDNLMDSYFKNILPDKLRLDQLYIRNRSFFVDLDTIFWTIAILVPRIVRARIPEGYLFAGPISRLVSRHLSWFIVDLIISISAAASTSILWRIQEPLNWGVEHLIGLAILIAFLFSGINSLAGINRIVWSEAFAEDGVWLALTSGIVTVSVCILNYLDSRFHWLPYQPLPTTMIFTMGLMASIGFVIVRYRSRLLTGLVRHLLDRKRGTSKVVERVLIIGSGEGYQIANWLLKREDSGRLLSVVGVVDDEEPAMLGMRVKGNLVLGGTDELEVLIKKYDVGVVLFAASKAKPEYVKKVENLCMVNQARMVLLTDLLIILQKQLTQPTRHRNANVY
jgi:lipopolysaccharide/colanic/teichoic acid biosynthesis glycosyltransferase